MTVNLPSSTIRKNLCTNPTLDYATTAWTYTLGGAALSRTTAQTLLGGVASGLVTWATAAAGAQAVGYPLTGLTNGNTYTVSGYVYVPAGMPRVNFDVLGGVSSAVSSVTGAWQRLSLTFTASGATATVRLECHDAGTAGQTAMFNYVLIEAGSTLGYYFDGNSANGWWDQPTYPSTSELLVPAGLNPSLPVMGWHVWNLENPPGPPFSTGPFTVPLILSDRARSLKVERGRQYELDQDQAGTASVRLVNNDGAIIGGRNNMFPARMAQLRVTYLGQTYILYTGYVATWPDKASDPATSESELTFVDLMDALANRPLDHLYPETIKAMSPPPDHFWPFSEPVGAAGALDESGGNASPVYPIVAYKGGDPGTLVFGGTSLATNDGGTTLTNDNASGPTGKASQVQLSGPNTRTNGTIQIDTTKPWMASICFKATAGKSAVFSILDNTGAEFASIWFDATAGTVNWAVGGATASVGGYLSGVNATIGYDGTSAFYGYGGGNVSIAGYASRGICSWIAAGASFNGGSISRGGNSTYWLQYLALWTSGAIPDITLAGPWPNANMAFAESYGRYFVSFGVANPDDVVHRISRVLKWANQGGLAGDASAPYLAPMPDSKGSAALDLIRQAALSVWGRFFIAKNGLPTFHSKDWNQSQTTPKYVFGSNTGAGELPYTGSPSFEYDLIHVYNDVQVTLGLSFSNATSSAVLQNGSVYRWVSQSSIGKYFQRILQVTSSMFVGTDAAPLAQYLANRYAEPDYRIGEIVLDPIGNPALWVAVLNLELDDVVQVNHRDLNGTRSAWYQVEKITHEADDGSRWNTTLQLSPFHQYWLLGAMHTTFHSSCLAGATSISINPLPDSATNPAEASLGVGTAITFEPGTPNAEAVTITSVTSAPTPGSAGYTSITVGVTATAHAHAAGAVVCDQLPTGVVDPTTWDARSVLGSTTVITA